MIFLQILGLIFLIIVLVVGFYIWRFIRKIKQGMADPYYTLINVIPPMEIELESCGINAWENKEKLIARENELRQLGAKHAGYFDKYDANQSVRISLWTIKDCIMIGIYEMVSYDHPDISAVAVDSVLKFNDKTSLTVTCSDIESPLPQNPLSKKYRVDPELTIKELVNQLMSKKPKDKKILPIKDVKAEFIKSYEEETEWLWQEEQIRSDKLMAMYQQLNIEVDEQMLKRLIEHGNEQRSELRNVQVKRAISSNPKMSAAQWEKIREDMVVIHSDMTASTLTYAVYEFLADASEYQQEVLDKLEESNISDPFEEFEVLKEKLNFSNDIKRIAKIENPFKAEVFIPV